MIAVLAAVLAGAAGWLWAPARDPIERIHRALRPSLSGRVATARARASSFPPPGKPPRGPAAGRGPDRREAVLSAVAGLTVFLATGGVPGAVAGVACSAIAWGAARRREPARLRRERERLTADLPMAADLMVACLRAGQPIIGAVDVTAEAIGGPLGDRLAWVSGQLRLGAAPENAWRVLAAERPLAPLARTMGRAALSGAPVADVLTRLADDSRHAARAASAAAARRVGVQVVAPLGLCFLPAFVFLGIVPVVAAIAGDVLLP